MDNFIDNSLSQNPQQFIYLKIIYTHREHNDILTVVTATTLDDDSW